jgi:hypothetical protein
LWAIAIYVALGIFMFFKDFIFNGDFISLFRERREVKVKHLFPIFGETLMMLFFALALGGIAFLEWISNITLWQRK